MNLSGRNAVVTGGSRGIGRAICMELAKRGANVAFCFAGNEDRARETEAFCQRCGVKVFSQRCDVTDAGEVKTFVEEVLNCFGSIDILVNNAGITRDGLLMTMKEEDFDRVLETNLKGAFLFTKAVSRPMVKARRGRIISISSVVGLHGNGGQSNYAASKAGIIGFTKAVAKELAGRGVTVNAVAPGFISTDMTDAMTEEAKAKVSSSIPMLRLGDPKDVARAVAFLASDNASYITGQVLAVDGGMSM